MEKFYTIYVFITLRIFFRFLAVENSREKLTIALKVRHFHIQIVFEKLQFSRQFVQHTVKIWYEEENSIIASGWIQIAR